jgi:prepilin-type N-terminal cleavage/methylation domain-containing protein
MRTTSARANAHGHDDGFTLIELLIGIAVSGLIIGAVATAFIAALGATAGSEKRMNASHDAQLVSTYLPADLLSATSIDTTETTASTCSGATGKNVLQLGWTEAITANPTVTFAASYRYVESGSEVRLVRYYCTSAGTSSTTIVAHGLKPIATPASPLTSGPIDAVVTCGNRLQLTLHEAEGYTYKVSGARRTPVTTPCGAATPLSVLTSLQMKDIDKDGRVDQLVAAFDSSLDASCSAGWALANVPSAGSLGTVAITGSTATITVNEGAGARDTAVGSFTAAISPGASCLVDPFTAKVPADGAAPVVVGVTSTDGDGMIETGDKLAVTFSEAVVGASGAVTVTETDPSGSGNDTMQITGFTNGALDMGSNGYISGNAKAVSFAGSVASSGATATVTITGTCTGNCSNVAGSSGAFVFDPDPTIKDAAGNVAIKQATSPPPGAGFKVF